MLFRSGPGWSPYRTFREGADPSTGTANELISAVRAYANVKHRQRMVYWYYRGEVENLLVLGACNLTELEVGFFVRYGDSGADIAPIEGLYKTQVFQLGSYLGLPETILAKSPSPDLLPGVTDEYALGLSYETLDRILHRLARDVNTAAVARELGLDPAVVEYVVSLRLASRPMREPPEVGPNPNSAGNAVGRARAA